MDWTSVVLRFAHVLSAVVWLGGVAYAVHFMQPGLRRLPPEAQDPAAVAIEARASRGLAVSAAFVFVTGGLLVIRTLGLDGLENLFRTDWGRSIFLGFLLAVAMFLVRWRMVTGSLTRLKALSEKGQATPDEASRLRQRARRGGVISFGLGTLALLEMVIAREFH
ncbi:MAG: hypothetical protein HY681_12835 [Chloroflexi bacterium]|nr:hypothetical protein [Chloroflexota bacterium]